MTPGDLTRVVGKDEAMGDTCTEVDRSMTEDFGIDLAQMTENAGPNLADLGQALAGGGSSCNGARAPATPPRRYRSGAGGEFSPVDDLDDAVADPDQAIVFQ